MATFRMKVDENYQEHPTPNPNDVRPQPQLMSASIWLGVISLAALATFIAGLFFAIAANR